jgi:hypothetical protein
MKDNRLAIKQLIHSCIPSFIFPPRNITFGLRIFSSLSSAFDWSERSFSFVKFTVGLKWQCHQRPKCIKSVKLQPKDPEPKQQKPSICQSKMEGSHQYEITRIKKGQSQCQSTIHHQPLQKTFENSKNGPSLSSLTI